MFGRTTAQSRSSIPKCRMKVRRYFTTVTSPSTRMRTRPSGRRGKGFRNVLGFGVAGIGGMVRGAFR